ncbi:uncharacterized protein LOC110704118 [Chenopodium quinoa]|uniref:uncharacterized protein LOC110704118 n=1 Tax=Chenopodium quinoa TaxID=63459 RepID=UPI000B7926B7|nr:uncharacterized protein LOC110704118 [Chenopodium quinoa]
MERGRETTKRFSGDEHSPLVLPSSLCRVPLISVPPPFSVELSQLIVGRSLTPFVAPPSPDSSCAHPSSFFLFFSVAATSVVEFVTMKRKERWWMYDRYDGGNARRIRQEFVEGVEQFIRFCEAHPESPGIDEVRCPCLLCKNRCLHDANIVKLHLYKKGFIPDYYEWVSHGEGFPTLSVEQPNTYHEMVLDALWSNHEPPGDDTTSGSDEEPNAQAKAFQELLKAAEQPLYEGSSMSVLEMASRIVSLKSEYNLPHRCVDGFSSLLNKAIPDNNKMGKTFYDTKKILNGLELPHKKIHAGPKGCMLFWKVDAELDKCRVCKRDRYKRTSKRSLVPIKELIYFPITPRLQQLFATKNFVEEMIWHSKNPRVQGTMAHPSDSEAWKHLDRSFPDFTSEPRNVRLGMCTDGFAPNGKFGGQYSCWPVILTPYNFPPSMCMKKPFMFLSLLVPGPKNPKGNLDVYMQPLIEELKQLWATAGKKAFPYCLDKSKAFWLEHGGKMSWFDCHRQFLPPEHPFRNNKIAFCKNKVEKGTPPHIISGDGLLQQVQHFAKATYGPEALASLKKMETMLQNLFSNC